MIFCVLYLRRGDGRDKYSRIILYCSINYTTDGSCDIRILKYVGSEFWNSRIVMIPIWDVLRCCSRYDIRNSIFAGCTVVDDDRVYPRRSWYCKNGYRR